MVTNPKPVYQRQANSIISAGQKKRRFHSGMP